MHVQGPPKGEGGIGSCHLPGRPCCPCSLPLQQCIGIMALCALAVFLCRFSLDLIVIQLIHSSKHTCTPACVQLLLTKTMVWKQSMHNICKGTHVFRGQNVDTLVVVVSTDRAPLHDPLQTDKTILFSSFLWVPHLIGSFAVVLISHPRGSQLLGICCNPINGIMNAADSTQRDLSCACRTGDWAGF